MSSVELLQSLRGKLLDLTQEYLDGMTQGKKVHELQPINEDINALILQIDDLESSLAKKKP